MIIEIRRHGEYDRQTGGLTFKSKKEAERISETNKYDEVFSAEPHRCIQTAETLGKRMVIAGEEFNDIKPGEDIEERIKQMFQAIFSLTRKYKFTTKHILIVTHSNLIAATECFFEGKQIPQNLDDLPVIPHLGGIRINISKQTV